MDDDPDVDASEPRKGSPDVELDQATFAARFRSQFQDPVFEALQAQLDAVTAAAWDAYHQHRKSPRTRRAAPEFADPDYPLAMDWLSAREAIRAAQKRHDEATGPARILLISGSSRSEHTCPGEVAKSYRLVQLARAVLDGRPDVAVEVLELHRLAAEYDVAFIPVRPASRPHRRCATGLVRAIQTIPSDRLRTG